MTAHLAAPEVAGGAAAEQQEQLQAAQAQLAGSQEECAALTAHLAAPEAAGGAAAEQQQQLAAAQQQLAALQERLTAAEQRGDELEGVVTANADAEAALRQQLEAAVEARAAAEQQAEQLQAEVAALQPPPPVAAAALQVRFRCWLLSAGWPSRWSCTIVVWADLHGMRLPAGAGSGWCRGRAPCDRAREAAHPERCVAGESISSHRSPASCRRPEGGGSAGRVHRIFRGKW